MNHAATLTAAGARLSTTYHRYLADPTSEPDFLAASNAYHAALEAQHGKFWQPLSAGPFSVPAAR